MKAWLASVLVGGVFAAGVAVGALGTQFYWWHRPFGPPPLPLGEGFAERMRPDLGLSDDQVRAIGEILRENAEEARKLHDSLHPQVRAVMERGAERIAQVLEPAQRIKFEKMRKQHGRRADFFLLGHGPMPPWAGRPGFGHGVIHERREPPTPGSWPPPGDR